MKGLSKSRYTLFCQCPKAFWLKLNKPELEVMDDSLQVRFEQGTEVGDLAMGLLGKYVDVSTYKEDGSLDLGKMIEKTRQEIEKKLKIYVRPRSPLYMMESKIIVPLIFYIKRKTDGLYMK